MTRQVVVIAGPSGSGKNVLIAEIVRRHPNCTRLVTVTTRAKRPGEQEGKDYHFFSQERFDKERASGNIPEHRFVPGLGTYYGTYLDIEGARLLKKRYDATTIFIMPESIGQFKKRLRARSPEWSHEEFEERMRITEEELRVHAPQYDYRVMNADGMLGETADDVVAILRKEGYTLA
ncbi:MAG: Guanylate kinase [Candidatus Kaiserbacteria bacterium GW2011_GWC2_49_12]|uniref:Guanylate kinase n=1 Tax=Candidatus Kaiserbacteria bacterium GW2011_GWC2_49_12 TaxID=1618675 RepID=A0A0G1VFZ4_9BACT|nr:MAG: Guanylate kinase [Candidatus Kaiserbacteria bacterium GW2011_GWC2_49_12]